jgi:hypothetical protein
VPFTISETVLRGPQGPGYQWEKKTTGYIICKLRPEQLLEAKKSLQQKRHSGVAENIESVCTRTITLDPCTSLAAPSQPGAGKGFKMHATRIKTVSSSRFPLRGPRLVSLGGMHVNTAFRNRFPPSRCQSGWELLSNSLQSPRRNQLRWHWTHDFTQTRLNLCLP